MSSSVSFYSLATGEFHPVRLSAADPEFIKANTPPGCVPLQGDFDPLRFRFDLSTGQVVEWQAPGLAAIEAQEIRDALVAEIQRIEMHEFPRAMREHAVYNSPDTRLRLLRIELRCAAINVQLNPGAAASARLERAQAELDALG